MAMIKILEWNKETGGYEYKNKCVDIPNENLKSLSKNKRNKLKRYGLKYNPTQRNHAKAYGIRQDYYMFFDSHKICRNPRTILIEQGF
jgi:hypothetical protein